MSLVDPPAGPIDVFHCKDVGIKMGFPQGWHEWTSDMFVAQGGVQSFTPEPSDDPSEPDIVYSLLMSREANMNLDQYTATAMDQMSQMFSHGTLPDGSSIGKLLYGPDSLKMGKESARSIEYIMNSGEGKHRFFQCWTVKYGYAFILLMSAPMKKFNQYVKTCKKAAETFEMLPECEKLVTQKSISRNITVMYGSPIVDKRRLFRVHCPSGWKVHTSSKTVRAIHSEYKGSLSRAEDEPTVLLSFDVTVDVATDLESLNKQMKHELRKAFGNDVEIQSIDVQRKQINVPDVDDGDSVVLIDTLNVGGQPGRRVRFRTAALRGGATVGESAYYELQWTVRNGKSFVLTFVSTSPVGDTRAEPLFRRLAASFEFIAEGYKPRYATRRYDNLELGMRMDYPEQFSCHEGVLGAVVSFVEDLPGEEFTAHVNFVCHRLEEMQLTGDLDQFNDVIKQQMPSFVQNATVEEEREAKLGGLTCRHLKYRGTLSNFEAVFVQRFTIRQGRAYIISFAIQASLFDAAWPRIEAVCFDSFCFPDDD